MFSILPDNAFSLNKYLIDYYRVGCELTLLPIVGWAYLPIKTRDYHRF
jgi:hypothetical protein